MVWKSAIRPESTLKNHVCISFHYVRDTFAFQITNVGFVEGKNILAGRLKTMMSGINKRSF